MRCNVGVLEGTITASPNMLATSYGEKLYDHASTFWMRGASKLTPTVQLCLELLPLAGEYLQLLWLLP